MRDTERIKPFLEEIGKLWQEKYPDYRFGQMMEIFRMRYGDTFYLEDDKFLKKFVECFGEIKEHPQYDFELLLNVGFSESDLRWLGGHNDSVLKNLEQYYYTPAALDNLKNMLAMGFSERTALGLWMSHGDAFMKDENVFVKDVKNMVNKFGKKNIEDYFWKYGDFPLFYHIGYESERKKEVLEEIQERFREERRENMKQLIDIGFDESEIKDLEEIYNEFSLDLVEEYYMEPVHLKRLKQLLDIGFDETLLLQLYVTDPDIIFEQYSLDVVERRIHEVEDLWQGFEMLDMQFYEILFGEDENEWNKVVDTLRG